MWATIPSRSRAGRSGWGSSGSRCSSTASTTCGSSSTRTCASCDSSDDDAHATGLGGTEPRRAFLRPPTEWAGPAALADRATGLGRTEPRRAFLRPPTEWAGPAAPVTMKIPYKWLQEFVDLRLAPAEAADRLTNAGIEGAAVTPLAPDVRGVVRSEEHTSELQSPCNLVCRLLLEKKKNYLLNAAVGALVRTCYTLGATVECRHATAGRRERCISTEARIHDASSAVLSQLEGRIPL